MTQDQEKFDQIVDYIRSAMQHLHVPGVAIGILDGEQEFSAGWGVTNLENPLPVNADTLFQIGSITKTVTATTIMRLVEDGRVEIDRPIRAYLPELRLADPATTEGVTLRHVFTHTGGWVGDYFGDAGPGDDALAKVVASLEMLAQETPLGEVWSYNNAGFFIAGRLIEVITGKTYEEAVQELTLTPLGMERSFYFARDAITYRVAAGHDAVYPGEERQPKVLRPWWGGRATNAMGGLNATIHDLLRYARFHMGEEPSGPNGRVLTKATRKAMQTPGVPAANGEWMGIAWFLRDVDGHRIVRHGGSTNGQMATFQLVPDRRFAVVVLTNSDRGSELYNPVVKLAFESFLGLVEPEPQPIQTPEAGLAPYVGRYEAAAQDLRLSLQDGDLVLQVIPKGGFPTPDAPPPPAPPPTRLRLCGPDMLLAIDEPFLSERGEFLRGPGDEIVFLRMSGRVHRRL